MKPLQPAFVPAHETEQIIRDMLAQWLKGDAHLRDAFPAASFEAAHAAITSYVHADLEQSQIFANDLYQVAKRDCGEGFVHLSIKRIDRQTIHDWRDLQKIKNQLVGPECEGVELYPAESRRVDSANQYHLWVSTNSAFRFPCGFETRCVTETPLGKSVNRKLTEK